MTGERSVLLAVGDLVGEFVATIEREHVWPVDWCAYLDEIVYQDPVVAQLEGFDGIPVPPGGLIFLSFLDEGWMQRVGVDPRRSMASSRRADYHAVIHVGDTVEGCARVAERFEKRRKADGQLLEFVVIETEYWVEGERAMTERVTYVTEAESG